MRNNLASGTPWKPSEMDQHSQDTSAAARHSILREPLLHFLLIGGLLFAFSMLRSGPSDDEGFRIHVGAERIAVLRAGFERDYLREPNKEELQQLVDEYVRTEACVREARALGLDRGDQLIRDHLRAKYELMLDDGAEPPEPTEEQLQLFLSEHPERYRTEDSISLMQVYLDPLQHEDPLTDAGLLLEQLTGDEDIGLVRALSDPGSLPPMLPLVALSEVGWQFDPLFAEAVAGLPVGEWSGPVESSYGVHLVLVTQRQEGRPLELDEIREDVRRDWVDDFQRRKLNGRIDEVLQQYEVSVDPLPSADAPPSATEEDGAE